MVGEGAVAVFRAGGEHRVARVVAALQTDHVEALGRLQAPGPAAVQDQQDGAREDRQDVPGQERHPQPGVGIVGQRGPVEVGGHQVDVGVVAPRRSHDMTGEIHQK
jgi:hypothetical protein